jgi:hypothetical protein
MLTTTLADSVLDAALEQWPDTPAAFVEIVEDMATLALLARAWPNDKEIRNGLVRMRWCLCLLKWGRS